jgi:hypothetical protein
MTAPNDLVWMSIARRGVDHHAIATADATATGCGRSTRTGVVLPRAEAADRYQSRPCPRCPSKEPQP